MADAAKSLTPRQLARREAIIQAVRILLAKHGYDGVNMREVAAEARVSPSTLYEIYESKDLLILQSVRSFFEEMEFEEESVAAGLDRFVHRLQGIGRFFAAANKQGEAISRLLFQDKSNAVATEVLLKNAVAARSRSIQEMVEAEQLAGVPDSELLARMLVSVTWGAVLFYQRGEIREGGLASELIRQSLMLLLPFAASRKAEQQIQAAWTAAGAVTR